MVHFYYDHIFYASMTTNWNMVGFIVMTGVALRKDGLDGRRAVGNFPDEYKPVDLW